MTRYRLLALGWIAFAASATACAQSPRLNPDPLRAGFLNPPADARPMMRWWWFGPAVTRPELARELETMQKAGIGGVEIQPVYPMSLDDTANGIRNLRYLSPEFLDAVSFANRTARSLGMRVSITLGSGWPYGGPGTTPDLAAGRLNYGSIPIRDRILVPPPLPSGMRFLAAFVVDGTYDHFDPGSARRVDSSGAIPPGATGHTVLYFTGSHTGQEVKRAAFGAEGFVLDHFSRDAIDEHLRDVGEPLLSAFGSQPPDSVFSDSLEVEGSDWTAYFPEEFLKRRGYDIISHLPELVAGGTPESGAVRHDWGKTLSELIRENYLAPITAFAEAHHTLFRSQTYGDPAVTLADEATPNLIEGEGMQWRQFSYCRWATSAAHLYGRNVVSAETWTWLHSPAFRATPLDVKAEADRMFLLGVNQFVGHGWPYSPPSAGEPGWAFYAAAVFNEHNPWFPVMPEITQYLTRVSWLLRQGKPNNDVAILLPEDDAQAAFTPGHVSVTDEMDRRITPELISAILDFGYNVDFIDAATIDKLGAIPYRVLILPPTDRIPLATYRRIEDFARTRKLIAVGKLPSLAPGLIDQKDSMEVALLSSYLFHSVAARGFFVDAADQLPAALHNLLPPDLDATGQTAGLGFIHRAQPDLDIYFVANTSNQPVDAQVRFRVQRSWVQAWDPDGGKVLLDQRIAAGQRIPMHFAPYESRIFVLRSSALPLPQLPHPPAATAEPIEDLSNGWRIRFRGERSSQPLNHLTSWTELPGRQFYSGVATYTRTFTMTSVDAKTEYWLDFGRGVPIADDRPSGSNGMHALLDPPIREAAIVFVNGLRAGALWHPPYRLDVTPFVRLGTNRIEVRVYNTAINELAGQPPRDLRALRAKYGTRFEPQDQDRIHPAPSGLLGPVRLLASPAP